MSSKEIKFGIDFGTTSCAVVGFIDGNLFHYGISGDRPFPSIVAINKDTGEIYTGENARAKRVELSESCEYIPSIKTMLDEDRNWTVCGKTYTPTDIASILFSALKANVESSEDAYEMNEAVVSIPIGFSSAKRDVLRKAAQNAGIKISTFVSEPTSAFFANYSELKADSNIVVFDWGGGTLDVSLISHEKGRISEMLTEGMAKAGDFIDLELAKKIHTRFSRTQDKKIEFEKMPAMARDRLLTRSERAKILLSDSDEATISVNNYGEYGAVRYTLEYDWFSDIINPVVTDALNVLKSVLEKANMTVGNIDRIILVGGSSRLRPLYEALVKLLGDDEDKIFIPEESMWSVGEGAAKLANNPGCVYSNQSVELVLSDGSHFPLLKPDQCFIENGKLWNRKFNFGITDTTKQARLVFSGSIDIDESEEKFKVIDIPTYNFLQETIILDAFVDDNMMFCVEAKSSNLREQFSERWEYPKLKSYYKLPDLD